MASLGSPPAARLRPLFLVFLLVASSLSPCGARCSEHPASGETRPAIRLPSEGAASGCEGVCARTPPSSCPVRCFRTDPVCGADGVTYWCGCAEAACAGAPVAKPGFCEVGNGGGNGIVPGQALLLVHIVWLVVLGFSVVCGVF